MRTTILIILLISTNVICGQKDSTKNITLSIKCSPLGLTDIFNGPNVKLGAETKVYKNIAASIELGTYIPISFSAARNTVGINVRPELKFYLNRNSRTYGSYISLEYQYKNVTFNYSDSINTLLNKRYYKDYTIHKNINCVTLKYGKLIVLKKRFVFEYHVGVGVRFINGYSTLTAEEENNIYRPGENSLIYSYISIFENYTSPNVDIGVKIGYKLK